MNKRLRNLMLVATAMVAMLAMTVGPALAQQGPPAYPPGRGLGIACEASGNQVVCTLAGAQNNETVRVVVLCDGRPAHRTTVTADGRGEGSFSFTAPAGAEDCRIQVLGASGEARANVAFARQVAGAPVSARGDRLPLTGTEVGGLLAVGVLLLGGGIFAVRRREDAPTAD